MSITPEPRGEEAVEPELDRRADPHGQPPASGDRRGRAGAAAAYAAAQHAAGGQRAAGGEDHVDTGLEDESEADTPVADVGAGGSEEAAAEHAGAEPEPAAPAAPELDLEELIARAGKADEYLSLAQRTQADFENYRKRAARDAALAQERGIAKLAKELLPAVDNLDRALAAALVLSAARPESAGTDPAAGEEAEQAARTAADTQLVDGLRLVHAELLAALARVGIEPFSPVGETFDPQHHEAVAQQPFEGQESGTVVEVYQQGFRLGEAVLRPARVLVAA